MSNGTILHQHRLDYKAEESERGIVLRIFGDVDLTTAQEFRSILIVTLVGVQEAVLDLRGVSHIDSRGLQVLEEISRDRFLSLQAKHSLWRLLQLVHLDVRFRKLGSYGLGAG